jgi:hypothetical protein
MSPPTHQHRPFSPYRHAHTEEDLLHAALRGQTAMNQAMPNDGPKPSSTQSRAQSRVDGGEVRTGSVANSKHSQPRSHAHPHAHDQEREQEGEPTPTPSRPHTPEGIADLNAEEERIVRETLGRTPRSSYAASALGSDILNSHFHDAELCALLHEAEDPKAHEVVRKAVRKAAKQRIKKLGMKYDNEVCGQSFFNSFSLTFIGSHLNSINDFSTTMILQFIPNLGFNLMSARRVH